MSVFSDVDLSVNVISFPLQLRYIAHKREIIGVQNLKKNLLNHFPPSPL